MRMDSSGLMTSYAASHAERVHGRCKAWTEMDCREDSKNMKLVEKW